MCRAGAGVRLLLTQRCSHTALQPPCCAAACPPACSYTARVELSSKVLDCFGKLERTLCHELCHVAAWLVDHTAKPPHGAVFKAWADRAMRLYTHLDITTCHAYEIFYPFRCGAACCWGETVQGQGIGGGQPVVRRCGMHCQLTPAVASACCVLADAAGSLRPCSPACPPHRRWQCSNGGCLQSYGRHSNSIDVAKKVCGACRAPLTFLGKFRPDGTPAKPRAANKMAQFVKEHMAKGGWAGCWLAGWLAGGCSVVQPAPGRHSAALPHPFHNLCISCCAVGAACCCSQV